MSSSVLAQEELIDHYKFPRNKKKIENPTFAQDEHNPSCGDRVWLTGIVKDGVLVDIGFQGTGCLLSLAAASMLTEQAIGKTIKQVLAFDSDYMRTLVGIELGPTRLKCATLALELLKRSLT